MRKDDYADVNGIRLHYVAEGDGDLILFLHGFPEFWYAWKNELAEFGRTHLAVAPDMRGYNLSSKPEKVEDYAIPHLVEDVRALAAHFGKKKFTLVGHDWGGLVAWAFAIAHPEMLDRLVIVNAPHPAIFERELAHNPAQRKASQYILIFRTTPAEMMLKALNYSALVALLKDGLDAGYFTEDDKRAYLDAWSQAGALTGGLNYYRAAPLGEFAGEKSPSISTAVPSPHVRVPTLVLWGEKDIYLLPGNLEGLDKYVPDLTIRRIPDGSHWVIHEKPELIHAAIREFLARRPPLPLRTHALFQP